MAPSKVFTALISTSVVLPCAAEVRDECVLYGAPYLNQSYGGNKTLFPAALSTLQISNDHADLSRTTPIGSLIADATHTDVHFAGRWIQVSTNRNVPEKWTDNSLWRCRDVAAIAGSCGPNEIMSEFIFGEGAAVLISAVQRCCALQDGAGAQMPLENCEAIEMGSSTQISFECPHNKFINSYALGGHPATLGDFFGSIRCCSLPCASRSLFDNQPYPRYAFLTANESFNVADMPYAPTCGGQEPFYARLDVLRKAGLPTDTDSARFQSECLRGCVPGSARFEQMCFVDRCSCHNWCHSNAGATAPSVDMAYEKLFPGDNNIPCGYESGKDEEPEEDGKRRLREVTV